MNHQKSIQRSMQLHQIGETLSSHAHQVPCGLQATQIKKHMQQKKALLLYLNATEKNWLDWQWQIANRIQTTKPLSDLLQLTSKQIGYIEKVSAHYRFAISPYYLSLIDWESPENNPVAKMSLPDVRELDNNGVKTPLQKNLQTQQVKLYAGTPTVPLLISQINAHLFADTANEKESSVLMTV